MRWITEHLTHWTGEEEREAIATANETPENEFTEI